MYKRFSHFFACVLLVLIPLQSVAAVNMAACNSLMQAGKSAEQAQNMPCHQNMKSTHTADKVMPSENHKNTCKATCATLCASLCAMTAIPSNIKPADMLVASQLLSFSNQAYASVTLPNLQRPPIFVS